MRLIVLALILTACVPVSPTAQATVDAPGSLIETPIPTITPAPTNSPAASATPNGPPPSPTPSLEELERPAFLAWPLPAYIGLARISQFPNSAWSWNYLGLTPGYECPPMFGYLLNVDSWPYWRDVNIPEAQDKAQADPHNFEMVACYSTDGSIGMPDGHEGTDIKAPARTPVYAAADGLVQEWRNTGLNSMIVLKHCLRGNWDASFHCAGGQQWYTTYMHIVLDQALLQENLFVAQGQELGRDVSPWLGCLWQDQSLCLNPAPAFKRMAVYADEELRIEQGDGSRVVLNEPGLRQISLWGERVAVMDSQWRLFVRDGKIAGIQAEELSVWKKVAVNVLDFQITDTRIAILDRNRYLLAKENSLAGEWFPLAANVLAFLLADTRLGYLTEQGDFFVQSGRLQNEAQFINNNALAIQLVDNRIAFVDAQRNLYVNEGEPLSEFKWMADKVKAFQVTNRRIGILDSEDSFWVKEGNLRAEWVLQAELVQAFQLADMRILVRDMKGKIRYKEGNLYQAWIDLPEVAPSVFLNGEMPLFVGE